MIIRSTELETVCGYTSVLPVHDMPEIAFAGKSNVGKSSLINCLMERKALAHTSSSPGKTQTINFYNINQVMYLTDLPGYGYAKTTVEEKGKWGEMIERYLHSSGSLEAVFLLLDMRHIPQEHDIQMYEWMAYQGYAPIIIATKLDKVRKSEKERKIEGIRDALGAEEDLIIIPFSAETKEGREEIWSLMDEIIGYEEVKKNTRQEKTRDVSKKPRWKESGKKPAKKTVRNQKKKEQKQRKKKH